MNFMSQAFTEEEEENNQIMNTRGKFPATADLSLGLSSNSSDGTVLEKEHMFDKVVTPSDVGKLNRLVIPKQHAERYFPLDSSTNEKGLLLNFEDRNGKPWRFRYSYWNSSQSYVMTKGWSRFVKDKKLDAGDIVSFHRGLGQLGKDRLFIDWRRRPETVASDSHGRLVAPVGGGYFSFDNYRSYPHDQQQWNYKVSGPFRDHGVYWQTNYQHRHQYHQSRHGYGGASCNDNNNNIIANPGGSGPYTNPHNITTRNNIIPSEQHHFRHLMYLRSSGVQTSARHDMTRHEPVYESVPVVVKGKVEKKRLRLFGVNMDCPLQESGEELRVVSSPSSSSTSMLPRFVNKGKSSFNFDIDI